MRIAFLAISIVYFSSYLANAADVSSSSGVLAYVIDMACPSGWTDLSYDNTYKGRLIKGWNTNTNLGAHSGSAITDNAMPMHSHPQWSRRLYFNDNQRTSCLGGSTERMVDDGTEFFLNEGNSQMDNRHPGIQRTYFSMRICKTGDMT